MAVRAAKTSARISKNRINLAQLHLACRHFQELRDKGVTENLAIRILEHFCDVYAKMLMGGSATPHHADEVPPAQWSLAAIQARKRNRSMRYGDYLRVEHGTPRRTMARQIFGLYQKSKLTERRLNLLVRRSWKLAVITLEEDRDLNRIARSKPYDSPDDRWQAAGIKFPTTRAPLKRR